MIDDPEPKESPLSQTIERDGRSVQVYIYDDGAGRWLLEIVDQFNNSNVWDQSFKTDQDALNEALETIRDEGIESLIDSDSDVAH